MRLSRAGIIALLLALALVLAACGGDDNDDADAGSSSIPALSQSITIEGSMPRGSLTVHYPDGYFATSTEDGEMAWIANNQELLNSMIASSLESLEAGEFLITVSVLPSDNMLDYMSLDEADADPVTVLAAVDDGAEGMLFSGVDPITLGGWSGAIATGTYDLNEETLGTTIVFLDAEGGYIGLQGFALVGEIGEYDELIRAIAASAQYTPSPAED